MSQVKCPPDWREKISLIAGKKCCDCPDYFSQLILRKPPQTSRIVMSRISPSWLQDGESFSTQVVIFVTVSLERKLSVKWKCIMSSSFEESKKPQYDPFHWCVVVILTSRYFISIKARVILLFCGTSGNFMCHNLD